MVVRLLQKAKPPMLVTLSGIVMLVRPVQLEKAPPPDAGDAVRNRDARQAAAITEGVIADADDAVTNRDARQAAAATEDAMPDAGDAVTNRDARQAGAAREGSIPDAGDTIRDRDTRQAAAVPKGVIPDAGDAVRDRVIGTCLACRISKQHRLLCIEQNPIDLRVIHVPRANLNRRQGAAPSEGTFPDAGDVVTNRDARQAGAIKEGATPDAGDAAGGRDTC